MGSVIGTRRDMADLIKIASKPGLQVIIETQRLAESNEVLDRLKKSEIQGSCSTQPLDAAGIIRYNEAPTPLA